MKTRYLGVFAVVFVLLLVAQAVLVAQNNQETDQANSQPTNQGNNQGNDQENNRNLNETSPANQTTPNNVTTYWLTVAENAWRYFQPGLGVDAHTGLHGALVNYHYFTDWDLGVYIQAIIDAEELGILKRGGEWGSDARLGKLLTFLENRPLTKNGLPFWWYETATGRNSTETPANAADTGKLLVALRNLKLFREDLATRVDRVVYERTNYEFLRQAVDVLNGSTNIYDYYVARGFAGFWPARFSHVAESILSSILSAPTVETFNVKLPVSKILCEPILYAVFELEPDTRIMELTKQVYLSHEAKFNATGKYVAFSEGNTALNEIAYAYEWVVMPDGRTWVIQDPEFSDVQIAPIIYFKVAVGFFAIYKTQFATNMVKHVESYFQQPAKGYMDGIDENGRLVTTISDKTNGLLLSAARYAVKTGGL